MKITNLAQEIQDAGGRFALVNLKIRERRATMLPAEQWFAKPVTVVRKGKGTVVTPTPAFEIPVRKFIPMSDCVSVEDELEMSHEDDPVEVGAEPIPQQAGEEEPEPDELEALQEDVVTTDGD